MATNAPVRGAISHDDHGAYVVVALYGSFFITLLFYIARIAGRLRTMAAKLDDYMLSLAMFFALLITITIHLAVKAGLGKRGHLTEKVNVDRFDKLYYTSLLLAILSQLCSKLSVNALLHSLRPFRAFVVGNFVVVGSTIAWALASILAISFACKLPNPWFLAEGRCSNLQAIHTGIDVVNIALEAVLLLFPVVLMPKVQTTWSVRLLVISCFMARLVVIAVLAGHISSTSALNDLPNAPYAYIIPTIWLLMIVNMSILTACIPGMQKVLAELRPGMIAMTIRNEDNTDYRRNGYIFGAGPYSSGPECSRSDGKTWETVRMDLIETESTRGLRMQDQEIIVTKEVHIT